MPNSTVSYQTPSYLPLSETALVDVNGKLWTSWPNTNSTLITASLPAQPKAWEAELAEIAALSDNWDEEGALAPLPHVIQQARQLLYQLNQAGQAVYHLTVSPNGVVVIECWGEDGRSASFFLFPERQSYVHVLVGKVIDKAPLDLRMIGRNLAWLRKPKAK
jgi:hypothetical protein